MEANKCFGRRRVEEECPRSASEKTSLLTARCAVSKGSARATASSAICAGKSITKSLPSAKRRSVKPLAKEAIRTETQKPVICRIAGFLFAQNLSFFRADLRRNAVSNLRFSSVIYVLVNSLGKSSFSLPCLQLRPERPGSAFARSSVTYVCVCSLRFSVRLVLLASANRNTDRRGADLRRNTLLRCGNLRSRTSVYVPLAKPRLPRFARRFGPKSGGGSALSR